jgi:hypothetical protein
MQAASTKCAKADCQIRTNATLNVFGKDWHADCFRCVDCNCVIDTHNDEYTQKNDGPVCAPECLPANGGTCFLCKKTIGNKRDLVRFMGETWHRYSCFSCSQCSQSFAGISDDQADSKIKMRLEQLYCSHHETHTCTTCMELIEQPNELFQPAGSDKSWHARCFACSDCQQKLDPNNITAYIVHDSLPTCKRHHLKCAKCAKPPARGEELVRVAKQDYHSACLVCSLESCGETIDAKDCIRVRDRLYCSWHPHCGRCQWPIREEELVEHAAGGTYHSACYTCAKCKCSLRAVQSELHDGDIVCVSCHPSGTCHMCEQILGEQHVVVLSSHFHYECFACVSCSTPFESTDDPVMMTDSGKPICHNCSTLNCHKCNLAITGEMIEAIGNSYHLACFVCVTCLTPLTGEFAMHGNDFVCPQCAEAARRPRCNGCSKVQELII